jgi:hypothetical protein
MQRSALLTFVAILTGAVHLPAQILLDKIITPERAVPVVNQSLSGLWLSELRRPGPAGLQHPIPSIVTFFADGTALAAPADGTQTSTHIVWIRVGDRKFLGTGLFFNFDVNRALTSVTKLRINYELGPDGKTLTGSTEAVILDPDGKVLNTLTGATFSMVRLSFEIPADFYDFQKLP